jgi:hypothetical protein
VLVAAAQIRSPHLRELEQASTFNPWQADFPPVPGACATNSGTDMQADEFMPIYHSLRTMLVLDVHALPPHGRRRT